MAGKRTAGWLLTAAFLLICVSAIAGEEFTVADITMDKQEIPTNEALAFVERMKVGWNLGNTFDAADCGGLSDHMLYESAWCGTITDPGIFDVLKEAGFASVRIPVSWHNHVSGEDFAIDEAWLARVRQVVDDALARGLYVILNTHHDVAQDYLYPDEAHYENTARYLRRIWEQVAETFRDYGERLIFEGMNEPRLAGTDLEWQMRAGSPQCEEAVECINRLNQLFVDVVRATGGENAARYLMTPGYCASADGVLKYDFRLPNDTAENRMIVSVHAYIPYAFALQAPGESGSRSEFQIGNARDIGEIDEMMRKLYRKYIQNGVPVVIGEFGARDKNGDPQSRADHYAYFVAAARAHGITCFVWDNHEFTGSGELFGLLDRKAFAFAFPEIVEGIMAYAD